MDTGKSICCVLLFQHLRKLLYSSNRQTYDAVVEVIQASFPQFSQYLEVNWFPHEALFAGFARAGVLHLDNHTNNRLERYHHTIKSVVGSSQVSVGILIDRLQKLLNVRVMSMQQAEFNQRMKSRVNVSDVVAGYSAFVSHFAADRIAYEHSKSLTMTNVVTDIDNDMFCVGKYNCSCTHCQCNAFMVFICRVDIFFLSDAPKDCLRFMAVWSINGGTLGLLRPHCLTGCPMMPLLCSPAFPFRQKRQRSGLKR